MCGVKSKSSLRRIGTGLLLLLVLASPLCAASNWGAIFGNTVTELSNRASAVLEEFSQEESELPSEESSQDDTAISEADLKKLTQLSNSSKETVEKLQTSLESLKADFSALESINRISDAEVDAIMTSLNDALEANTKQADRLAELEKATKTRPYIMLGGAVGFDEGVPTLSADLSVGARIGNHWMVEAGVEYDMGRYDSLVSNILTTDLNSFGFGVRAGYMF